MTYHVAISKPHQESYAGKHLANQGCEVYIPLCLTDVSRKTTSVYSPLIPRYFIFNPHGLAIRKVLNTRGISGIVKQSDGSPANVSQKDFDWWQAMTASVQDFRRKAAHYMIGQTLEVSDGPFAGLIGQLIELSGERLKLELPAAKNSLKVTVSKTDVMIAAQGREGEWAELVSGPVR